MPPKKSDKTATPALIETSIKPEDAEFFLQCLKAFDSDGAMDIAAVSAAIGHTNVMSTRNAFSRLKKKWGLGNIPTKNSGGAKGGQDTGSGQDDVLKPNTSNGKVAKTRGRPGPKAKASKTVKEEEDPDATESDVKAEEVSEEDA